MTDPLVETTETLTTPDGTEAVAVALPRPRIRTGAIAWGLIVAGVAFTALVVLSSPARRAAAVDWILSLDAFTALVVSLVLLGGFILVLAVVSLIRRAQRSRGQY